MKKKSGKNKKKKIDLITKYSSTKKRARENGRTDKTIFYKSADKLHNKSDQIIIKLREKRIRQYIQASKHSYTDKDEVLLVLDTDNPSAEKRCSINNKYFVPQINAVQVRSKDDIISLNPGFECISINKGYVCKTKAKSKNVLLLPSGQNIVSSHFFLKGEPKKLDKLNQKTKVFIEVIIEDNR